jgi:cell wall integrity and stress response component
MISTRIVSAFAAAAMLFTATHAEEPSSSSKQVLIPTPTVTLPANPMTDVGCFATGTPLENHGPWMYQSPGNCQFICIMLDKPVMALSDGVDCWCGDLKPPQAAQVRNGSCDTTCAGTSENLCGGPSLLWVSLTGTTRNRVDFYKPESSSSSSTTPTSTPTSIAAPKNTAVQTPTDAPEEKKGPNKAGIAAGVVVGVVALAAIVGGAIFFLRQRKRREIEEEHRRREQVNSFMAGGKLHTSNSSMTDSRLDPEFMNRRQSNGSIADNEDYSRRILKVTNA